MDLAFRLVCLLPIHSVGFFCFCFFPFCSFNENQMILPSWNSLGKKWLFYQNYWQTMFINNLLVCSLASLIIFYFFPYKWNNTYFHGFALQDLPETIPYLKIYTIGHQVPDDDTIFKFKCAVNEFLKENTDNGEFGFFLLPELWYAFWMGLGFLLFFIVLTLGLLYMIMLR